VCVRVFVVCFSMFAVAVVVGVVVVAVITVVGVIAGIAIAGAFVSDCFLCC